MMVILLNMMIFVTDDQGVTAYWLDETDGEGAFVILKLMILY